MALYRRLDADTLVAEVNMGGEMVRAVLREIDAAVPLKEVHATRGKYLRAEPVAALYEQGKVKHVGCLPLLEDEMCDFGIDGLSSRPLAGPARRAGVGDHRADERPQCRRAADQAVVRAGQAYRMGRARGIIAVALAGGGSVGYALRANPPYGPAEVRRFLQP